MACRFLLLYLFCYFAYFPNTLSRKILGIREERKNSLLQVRPDEFWLFTIYGQELPAEGYFLTSTQHCRDFNNTSISKRAKVQLDTIWPPPKALRFRTARNRSWVTVRTQHGVPFTDDNGEFQICHLKINSTRQIMMLMRSSYEDVSPLRFLLIAALLLGSAFCSGLNIAFFTYNVSDLESIIEANIDEVEKAYAEKILNFRKKSNYLICTFSAANCILNVLITSQCETSFVNFRDSQLISMCVSTILTVLIGEIFPQVCSHRNALSLAAKTRFVTWTLFVVMFPFAFPLSKIIDWTLGREAREVLTNDQLKLLVSHHANQLDAEMDERDILIRTIKFPEILVRQSMTPISYVYSLSNEAFFTNELCLKIVERGMYTRIPVFSGKDSKNIIACVNMSDLISVKKTGMPIKDILKESPNTALRITQGNMYLQQLSEEMKTGKYHMCAVSDFKLNRNEVVGIVTAEDVWEQLFGDIQDEADNAFVNKRAGMRRDQQTLDWFHDRALKFSVNQYLNLIEQVFDACPQFRWFGFSLHSMRNVLNTNAIKTERKKDAYIRFDFNKLYVMYQGKFETVVSGRILDKHDLDVSLHKAVVFGRQCVINFAREYQETFITFAPTLPPPVPEEEIDGIRTLTVPFSYFEISDEDIRKVLSSEVNEAQENFQQRLIQSLENANQPTLRSSGRALDDYDATNGEKSVMATREQKKQVTPKEKSPVKTADTQPSKSASAKEIKTFPTPLITPQVSELKKTSELKK